MPDPTQAITQLLTQHHYHTILDSVNLLLPKRILLVESMLLPLRRRPRRDIQIIAANLPPLFIRRQRIRPSPGVLAVFLGVR